MPTNEVNLSVISLRKQADGRGVTVLETFCRAKLAPLTLRLALGLFCVYHGYIKIMANGGTSWSPSLGLTWQLVVAWGEFTGGLAILLGLHCRIAAGGIVVLIVGLLIHGNGWRLWRLPIQSLELPVLLSLCGLALLFLGAGELSLDQRGGGKAFRKK